MTTTTARDVTGLLIDAVWRGIVHPVDDSELTAMLDLARRNQVEGRLARAYPDRLSLVAAEVEIANSLFERNLRQVSGRLLDADIPVVLIKADLSGDYVYTNFDLVLDESRWDDAITALEGWYLHPETYWLEHSTKLLLHPAVGPAAHLHKAVAWFDVPVVSAAQLTAGAAKNGGDWLLPTPADALRIWLAHAVFQNLALDLSELFAVRSLLDPTTVATARRAALREGWRIGFDGALAIATRAVTELDRGTPVPLPVPLPTSVSLTAGVQHASHLLRHRSVVTGIRELALRIPLILAKRRRMRAS